MTEIKDPILAAMEFSLNYTLKRFEDTETEDGKIIREGIIRGKTLVEHLRIFGADVYGKSKEQFACVVYCKCKDHLKQLRRNKN